MAYVYILKSKRDNRYYIGSTGNLEKRIKHHLGGFTHSTSRFGELELVLVEEYKNLHIARIIEKKLKKLKRHDYIEKIVRDGFIKIRP